MINRTVQGYFGWYERKPFTYNIYSLTLFINIPIFHNLDIFISEYTILKILLEIFGL